MESDESLGYHWGSWLGEGIQPRDGLTDGEEARSLEPSLLLSLAGERAASSPAGTRWTTSEDPPQTTSTSITETLRKLS